MTREQARRRQAELKEEIDFLTEKHIEMIDAAAYMLRDLLELQKQKDKIDSRLEHDGTSFITKPPSQDSFEDNVKLMMGLGIRK